MPVFLVTAMFVVIGAASGQIGDVLKHLGNRDTTDNNGKAASGLKEALEVGTKNTIAQTGVTDGFFRNEAIKILLPEKLRLPEKGLRLAGQGALVDNLVLSMNRAAEKAAPAAGSIFKDAITHMTFADASRIVGGGDTAATEFFKEHTSDQLRIAFRPPVKSAMQETGVTDKYKTMIGSLPSVPFGRAPLSFDLDEFVIGKTLDGLFLVLGQEERKIRTNPASQVTPLLREVFGHK